MIAPSQIPRRGLKANMNRILQLSILIFSVQFLSCTHSKESNSIPASHYHRIISFAPSITETLFALGLGERVVGVTRYCNYPQQAKTLPRVGGYFDPDYEMILTLKPDIVFILKEHSSIKDFLRRNNINCRVIDDENVSAILGSFSTIGTMFGKAKQADSLVSLFRSETARPVVSSVRPRVLLCIGRDNPGSGAIAKVYLAGPKSFYSELINDAGAENAYADSTFSYPSFSGEGVLRLAPDIVIDLSASVAAAGAEKVRQDWNRLDMVPAVKNLLVFCPVNDFMTIPGPRIGLIVREIRKTVDAYYQWKQQ
jgi:iron complex transport system substrate-binding protein